MKLLSTFFSLALLCLSIIDIIQHFKKRHWHSTATTTTTNYLDFEWTQGRPSAFPDTLASC
uniref:Secreted protein n=1 Tax=Macrostomum lignano TaxID=282301 RepID=A0A1I8I3N4_9PLAT